MPPQGFSDRLFPSVHSNMHYFFSSSFRCLKVFIVLILCALFFSSFVFNFPMPFPIPSNNISLLTSFSPFHWFCLIDAQTRAQCNLLLSRFFYIFHLVHCGRRFFFLSYYLAQFVGVRVIGRRNSQHNESARHSGNNCLECNLCYCFDRFRVSKNSRVSEI